VIRKEAETGPSGPVFLWLLLSVLVQVSCATQEAQLPTIDLERVHDSGAHRIAFDPGSNKLASGGFRGKVHVWSVHDGRLITTLDGHRNSIRGLAWLDDTTLISADRSGLINVRSLSSSRVIRSTKLKVISVDISPDGNQWFSLGRQTDSNVRLVDADSNRVLRRFKAHELCGWQARFSPDGRYAASSAEDGSVHIYDLHEPYRPVTLFPEFDD